MKKILRRIYPSFFGILVLVLTFAFPGALVHAGSIQLPTQNGNWYNNFPLGAGTLLSTITGPLADKFSSPYMSEDYTALDKQVYNPGDPLIIKLQVRNGGFFCPPGIVFPPENVVCNGVGGMHNIRFTNPTLVASDPQYELYRQYPHIAGPTERQYIVSNYPNFIVNSGLGGESPIGTDLAEIHLTAPTAPGTYYIRSYHFGGLDPAVDATPSHIQPIPDFDTFGYDTLTFTVVAPTTSYTGSVSLNKTTFAPNEQIIVSGQIQYPSLNSVSHDANTGAKIGITNPTASRNHPVTPWTLNTWYDGGSAVVQGAGLFPYVVVTSTGGPTVSGTISTLKAPSAPGTYHIHAHHYLDDGEDVLGMRFDDLVFIVVAPANQPPSIPEITGNGGLPGAPFQGFVNTNYDFTFKSIDPEGHGINYGIDWANMAKDKTDWVIGGYVPATGYKPSNVPALGTKPFTSKGSKIIHARAFDAEGTPSVGWGTYTFNIINRAPDLPVITEPVSPATLNDHFTNHTQSISVLGTDPDNDYLQYQVDWGDPSDQTDINSSPKAPGNSYTPAHAYKTAGTYTITASTTDIDATDPRKQLRSPKASKTITISTLAIIPMAQPCKQSLPSNIPGWAWSSTIGWISMGSNSANSGGGQYGVTVSGTGALVGCAWSSNIGWIKFGNLTDPTMPNSGFPTGGAPGTEARIVNNTTITGWARACAGTLSTGCNGPSRTDGWDGWIELSGVNHTTTYDIATKKISGWAWGGDVVGWIGFGDAITQTEPFCHFTSPTTAQNFISNTSPPPAVDMTWDSNADYCTITDSNNPNSTESTTHRLPTMTTPVRYSPSGDTTYLLRCFNSDATPIIPSCNSGASFNGNPIGGGIPVHFGDEQPIPDSGALSITVDSKDRYGKMTSFSTATNTPNYPPVQKVRSGHMFTLSATKGNLVKNNRDCTITDSLNVTYDSYRDTILSSGKTDMTQGESLKKYTLTCTKNFGQADAYNEYTSIKVQMVDPSINEF